MTDAQIAAARRNGSRSRGPVTARGKAVSSRNAVRYGVFCAIPDPNAVPGELHDRLLDRYRHFRPASELERALVDRLAAARSLELAARGAETEAFNNAADILRASGDERFDTADVGRRLALTFRYCRAHSTDLQHLERLERGPVREW